jgi:hypothetical protein
VFVAAVPLSLAHRGGISHCIAHVSRTRSYHTPRPSSSTFTLALCLSSVFFGQ